MSKVVDKKFVTGGETEGGITSSYATNDGIKLKVPYSFFGSIYDEAEEKAAIAAMKQDSLTMGPKTQEFQKKFAAICGVKHALAVSNCTTGMHIATQLFDIKAGDEVIVTPNTFVATSLVILKEKAIPVYADINPHTYNMDPKNVEKLITKKTKAIYVVHYAGLMVDMDPIMELAKKHGLYVLEDCAHAHIAEYKGRKAGTIGDIGVFSFHSLKNMTTCGEGGMLITNNDKFAKGAEMLRCMNLSHWTGDQTEWKYGNAITKKKESALDYWIPSHFDVEDWNGHWGNNYRMNEIQAAVGCCQVDKLNMLTDKRRQIGNALREGLKGIKGVSFTHEPEGYKHVYHLFTICVEKELGATRDEFMRVLYREEGIQTILHYQPTFHLKGLHKLGHDQNQCPVTQDFFYNRQTNLPMHPRLTEQNVKDMVEGIWNAAKKVRK